jgi:hypothetical protein
LSSEKWLSLPPHGLIIIPEMKVLIPTDDGLLKEG